MGLNSRKVIIRNIVKKSNQNELILDYVPKIISHPTTYLNKVLVGGEKELELWNISTGNKIFKFSDKPPLQNYFKNHLLRNLEESPVVNFYALGFSSGHLVLVNILENTLIKEFQISSEIQSIAFSKNFKYDPVLCNIILISLWR